MGEMTEQQKQNLAKGQVKPGDPARNPTGINGWTKMRERFREKIDAGLETMTDVLIAEAKSGNIPALRIALGGIALTRVEISNDPDNPVDFASLAAKAQVKPKSNGHDTEADI